MLHCPLVPARHLVMRPSTQWHPHAALHTCDGDPLTQTALAHCGASSQSLQLQAFHHLPHHLCCHTPGDHRHPSPSRPHARRPEPRTCAQHPRKLEVLCDYQAAAPPTAYRVCYPHALLGLQCRRTPDALLHHVPSTLLCRRPEERMCEHTRSSPAAHCFQPAVVYWAASPAPRATR